MTKNTDIARQTIRAAKNHDEWQSSAPKHLKPPSLSASQHIPPEKALNRLHHRRCHSFMSVTGNHP